MKKLMLAFAVLAVFTISLVSFSTKTVATEKTEFQESYVWIRYSCQPFYASTPMSFTHETNRVITTETGFPSAWGNSNFNNCIPSSTYICAVRFAFSETEPWPGMDGHRRPKADVSAWSGIHRMYAYCQ